MPITITWRQIRDDTVTTVDIKDWTIWRIDLDEEVKNKIDSWWGWWWIINFSFYKIPSDKYLKIEDWQQMALLDWTTLDLEWTLEIEWELLLYNI